MIVVVSACAAPAIPIATVDAPDVHHDETRLFTIWLGGARVGSATEIEDWSATGVVLRRTETLTFLRGEAPVAMTTTIEIAADAALVPSTVTWTERGAQTRHASARRDERGWLVDIGGEQLRLAGTAIPAELVPLYVRRDGKFAGDIFLPARGFVGGRGRIDPVAPARLVARLALEAGPIAEATIDVDRDGSPARVVDGEGVIALRATAAQLRAPFDPVDLVAATSIPLTGTRDPHRVRLALVGDIALPAVPGQAAELRAAGLEVALGPRLPGALPAGIAGADRTREIAALVAGVQQRIVPDLGASIATPRDASAATAGDCTTFALAYAATAQRAQIPTRVVTGLRVDGERLVRHRWAVSWTGRAWIAVDAAFGRAPAGGDLIGLAVHDPDDAGLIAGEAALMQVRAAAWTR